MYLRELRTICNVSMNPYRYDWFVVVPPQYTKHVTGKVFMRNMLDVL